LRQRTRLALAVGPRAAQHHLDLACHALGLFRRGRHVADVLHGQEAQPRAERRRLGGELGKAGESAFVYDLGHEPAHVRVHAPRAVEEDTDLAVVAEVGDPVGLVLGLGARTGFLDAADAHTFFARGAADLVEQVVDGLVARGRDAHAPATAHEIDDDPRAGPRLAGPRRPLDEEVARVERRGPLALLAKNRRLDRRAEAAAESRQRPGGAVFG